MSWVGVRPVIEFVRFVFNVSYFQKSIGVAFRFGSSAAEVPALRPVFTFNALLVSLSSVWRLFAWLAIVTLLLFFTVPPQTASFAVYPVLAGKRQMSLINLLR